MKIFLVAFPCLILLSCDCIQYTEGIVIDSESKLGIQRVAVFKSSRPDQVSYTNASGYYEWDGISGGLSLKCPEPKLCFVHPDYDTVRTSESISVVRMNRRE